jgi:ABC-2 type transport system ATP-binding protein
MDSIIEINNIVKTYTKRKTKETIHAVKDVSFQVKRGEVLGLLGPNGAGKTTTIKIICGLLQSDSGNVLINGIDTKNHRLKALQHISAVLEGNRNLYWRLTVRENLEYFAGNRGYSRKEITAQVDTLLQQFNLVGKANELVNGLSRGMQQKLAIAVAMMANTDVILLDEPTLGLDVETSYEVREMLKRIVKEENRTIIISTHDMPVVQDLCARTVIINDGKIVVDDQVSNLMKLFDTRAYSIQVNRDLTQEQQNLLIDKFPLVNYTYETEKGTIEVNLEHSEDIYELMDILKLDRTPVESIDRTTIDFEEVFMNIVKGKETYEMAKSS